MNINSIFWRKCLTDLAINQNIGIIYIYTRNWGRKTGKRLNWFKFISAVVSSPLGLRKVSLCVRTHNKLCPMLIKHEWTDLEASTCVFHKCHQSFLWPQIFCSSVGQELCLDCGWNLPCLVAATISAANTLKNLNLPNLAYPHFKIR